MRCRNALGLLALLFLAACTEETPEVVPPRCPEVNGIVYRNARADSTGVDGPVNDDWVVRADLAHPYYVRFFALADTAISDIIQGDSTLLSVPRLYPNPSRGPESAVLEFMAHAPGRLEWFLIDNDCNALRRGVQPDIVAGPLRIERIVPDYLGSGLYRVIVRLRTAEARVAFFYGDLRFER